MKYEKHSMQEENNAASVTALAARPIAASAMIAMILEMTTGVMDWNDEISRTSSLCALP